MESSDDEEYWECPVCLQPIVANILQCKNGHLMCEECRVKSKEVCPSCGECFDGTRNRALEKLRDRFMRNKNAREERRKPDVGHRHPAEEEQIADKGKRAEEERVEAQKAAAAEKEARARRDKEQMERREREKEERVAAKKAAAEMEAIARRDKRRKKEEERKRIREEERNREREGEKERKRDDSAKAKAKAKAKKEAADRARREDEAKERRKAELARHKEKREKESQSLQLASALFDVGLASLIICSIIWTLLHFFLVAVPADLVLGLWFALFSLYFVVVVVVGLPVVLLLVEHWLF